MSHTPEPWIKQRQPGGTYSIFPQDSDGRSIAAMMSEPNADRLIAVVNGCAGLNPAAFRECVEALHYLLDPIERPADAIVRLRQVLAHAEERG